MSTAVKTAAAVFLLVLGSVCASSVDDESCNCASASSIVKDPDYDVFVDGIAAKALIGGVEFKTPYDDVFEDELAAAALMGVYPHGPFGTMREPGSHAAIDQDDEDKIVPRGIWPLGPIDHGSKSSTSRKAATTKGVDEKFFEAVLPAHLEHARAAQVHGYSESSSSTTTTSPTSVAPVSSKNVVTQVAVLTPNTLTVPSASPLSSICSLAFAGGKPGRGVNNLPIKKIKGTLGNAKDKKYSTYPNKHGQPECKPLGKAGCNVPGIPMMSCLQDLRRQIYAKACKHPNMTYSPMQPIACSPNVVSSYCAYVQYVQWLPKGAKEQKKFDDLNTAPYKGMKYNQVPIGAIVEGIDWIIEKGAKLCGESLLPVPNQMAGGMPGHVYILKVDIDHEINLKPSPSGWSTDELEQLPFNVLDVFGFDQETSDDEA